MNTVQIKESNSDAKAMALWLIVTFLFLNASFDTWHTFWPAITGPAVPLWWDFFKYILPVIGLSICAIAIFTRNIRLVLVISFIYLGALFVVLLGIHFLGTVFPDQTAYLLNYILLVMAGIFYYYLISGKNLDETIAITSILYLAIFYTNFFIVLCWLVILISAKYLGKETDTA